MESTVNPECLVDISNLSTAKNYLHTWEGQERFKAKMYLLKAG